MALSGKESLTSSLDSVWEESDVLTGDVRAGVVFCVLGVCCGVALRKRLSRVSVVGGELFVLVWSEVLFSRLSFIDPTGGSQMMSSFDHSSSLCWESFFC